MPMVSWDLIRALWQSYWCHDTPALQRVVQVQQEHYWEYRAELQRQYELQQRLLSGRATLHDTSEVVRNVWDYVQSAIHDFLYDNLAIWPTLLLIVVWIYPTELYYGSQHVFRTGRQVYTDATEIIERAQQQWQALQSKVEQFRKISTSSKSSKSTADSQAEPTLSQPQPQPQQQQPQPQPQQPSPTTTTTTTTGTTSSILKSSTRSKSSASKESDTTTTLPSQSLSQRDVFSNHHLSPLPTTLHSSSRVQFAARPNQPTLARKEDKVQLDASFFGDSYNTDATSSDDDDSVDTSGAPGSSIYSLSSDKGIPLPLGFVAAGGDTTEEDDPLGGGIGFGGGGPSDKKADKDHVSPRTPTPRPVRTPTPAIGHKTPLPMDDDAVVPTFATKPRPLPIPKKLPPPMVEEEAFPGAGGYNPNKYKNRPKFKSTLGAGGDDAFPSRGMGFGTRTSFSQLDVDEPPPPATTPPATNTDDGYFTNPTAMSAKQQLAQRMRRSTHKNPTSSSNSGSHKHNGVLQSMLDTNVLQHGSAIPEDEEVDPAPQHVVKSSRPNRKSSMSNNNNNNNNSSRATKSSLNGYRRSSIEHGPSNHSKPSSHSKPSNHSRSSSRDGSRDGSTTSSRRASKKPLPPRKSSSGDRDLRRKLGYE